MSVIANMPDLQHLELVGNTGITGPLADADPDTSSGLCSVIQVCPHQRRACHHVLLVRDLSMSVGHWCCEAAKHLHATQGSTLAGISQFQQQ